jgi:hypothetical protein
MTLNPEQLRTAGRKLCELRGQDPDEVIEVEQEQDPMYAIYYPPAKMYRWLLAAQEIDAHLTRIAQLNEAIASVKP